MRSSEKSPKKTTDGIDMGRLVNEHFSVQNFKRDFAPHLTPDHKRGLRQFAQPETACC
jgi:hypothetical protein